MNQQVYGESFAGSLPENYQRYFVPAIGAPVAEDLIAAAGLRPGQGVLDVACGTGVVTRMAAERVGTDGAVTGLDVNPGMLGVARAATPPDLPIEWCEADAQSIPLHDDAFGTVLCQMGLQFVPGKLAALREMRRVLEPGGRAWVTLPGPKPPQLGIMTDALARHLGPDAASFADLVFSLHDVDEVRELMRGAGFREVEVQARPKSLQLPAPADFFWQYIHSTPLAEAVDRAGDDVRAALEQEVSARWQDFVVDGGMRMDVGMTTASGVK